MIFETMMMHFSEARGTSNTTVNKMKDQQAFLKNGFSSAIFLLFLGSTFLIYPEFYYYSIFQVFLPLTVIIVGLVIIGKGITWRPVHRADQKGIVKGGEDCTVRDCSFSISNYSLEYNITLCSLYLDVIECNYAA